MYGNRQQGKINTKEEKGKEYKNTWEIILL